MKLFWKGSLCKHVEPVGDEAEYSVGDNEPCVHCEHVDCVAVVRKCTCHRATRVVCSLHKTKKVRR